MKKAHPAKQRAASPRLGPRVVTPLAAWLETPLARRLALPVVLAVAAAVHAPALGMFFAQDDVTFLARATGLTPTPWSLARPLSEGWTWRALHALFGLSPLPYHLFAMALHLASTALVYAIGKRLLESRTAALAAALLFGVSSIAFTALHWTSCIVELMVTCLTLAAFWLWLSGRERDRVPLLWLGAACGLAALLSKETAVLLPLVMAFAHLRLGAPRLALRTLVPQGLATAAWVIGFLATLRLVHFAASETYSMSRSPSFVALNAATYLRWLALPHVPVRDVVAAMNPAAGPLGLAVALAIGAILWTQRRAARHPEEVGVVWFLAFLAPVVALKHHTYLYYLYLPWAGLCWFLAAAGLRAIHGLARRASAAAALAGGLAAVALAGLVAVEFASVRAREHAMRGNFPLDKTVREGMLLENAIRDLGQAKLAAGTRIAFVNPAPRQHVATVDSTTLARNTVHSYIPLEAAMRGGETLRVFYPGLQYAGFGDRLPPEWEDAEVFLFQDEGALRAIGRGGRAHAELGYFLLRAREFERAEAMFLRSRALGDTLADATFGLLITRDFLGDAEGSQRYAEEFLRRWPDDERAKVVAGGGAEGPAPAAPPGAP